MKLSFHPAPIVQFVPSYPETSCEQNIRSLLQQACVLDFSSPSKYGSNHGLCDWPYLWCHLNPAVSIGLWAGGRFPANQLLPYIIAQILGALVASGILFLIASGKVGFDVTTGFASFHLNQIILNNSFRKNKPQKSTLTIFSQQ